ncbi:Cytosolic phospholipase A2 gamma [Varanus komodoensis]|nr:Cytosolic phospholipase A2 gamma [Varanus komodoensis]
MRIKRRTVKVENQNLTYAHKLLQGAFISKLKPHIPGLIFPEEMASICKHGFKVCHVYFSLEDRDKELFRFIYSLLSSSEGSHVGYKAKKKTSLLSGLKSKKAHDMDRKRAGNRIDKANAEGITLLPGMRLSIRCHLISGTIECLAHHVLRYLLIGWRWGKGKSRPGTNALPDSHCQSRNINLRLAELLFGCEFSEVLIKKRGGEDGEQCGRKVFFAPAATWQSRAMKCNVSQGRVRVRISNDLSEGEKRATATRKEEVKKGLDKLGIPCDVDNIPNIAVLASGGALRAMVALCGTLVELRKYNLLDCIMYLGGVSGSTWCMSGLYKNKDWVEKIEELEKCLHETLTQGKWETKKAIESVLEAAEDECYSLTDIWSYFIVHRLLNQFDETTLSVHGASCENGKNPYPIYAAVEAETYQKPHAVQAKTLMTQETQDCAEDLSAAQTIGTWLEFTPHEAGFPGIGAYVDIKYFGSVFHNGQMIEERKEKNACYLQGLWGSALGSKEEAQKKIVGIALSMA